MERNLKELSDNHFDILVIGGGIHGAFVAWDAASRGLQVALIDKGDFGNATSQNSLKIIHGGLRYVQDGNIAIIRNMVKERSYWLKIAPHLVRPLPCLLPTNSSLTRNRFIISLVLQLNNLLSYDRNRFLHPQQSIPDGKWITCEEVNQLIPEINSVEMTGVAMWHDAQIFSTERLLMSVIKSASYAGAVVANYVEAVGFNLKNNVIKGVKVQDVISGQDFEIRASLVINCAGAWIDSVLDYLGGERDTLIFSPSIALNLVTRKLWDKCALGLSSRPYLVKGNSVSRTGSQVLFFVPWRDYSIIGTWHIPWNKTPEDFDLTEEIIQPFLDAINSTDQNLNLTIDDVLHIHYGFLPMLPKGGDAQKVRLVREGKIINHQHTDGIKGLITVLGVKYTTSRLMAKKAIDMAFKKLEIDYIPSQTDKLVLDGGDISSFTDFLSRVKDEEKNKLPPSILENLVHKYGSRYKNILKYFNPETPSADVICKGSPVIDAEIIHAVREEMAQTLADVIFRRTELGSAGLPERTCLEKCAQIIGTEMGWDENRRKREIESVYDLSPKFLARTTH
jgi:glycerol-3-phosphate dehydrogenase